MTDDKREFITQMDDKIIVAFGWGGIQMGVATDGTGQVEVHLADVCAVNEIGPAPGIWEGAKGKTVILGFNAAQSIDVLIKTLEDAKAALLDWKVSP